MSQIPISDFMNVLVTLLTEAYAGPPEPGGTWFVDNQPDSGLFGILGRVSASEASRSVDGSGEHGTTIAAHAEHLRWSLENTNNTIRGGEWNPNWAKSWALDQISEGEWDWLRKALQTEFETLLDLLSQQTDLQGEYLTGTLALVPHAAYHLGVIRQMVERVRG